MALCGHAHRHRCRRRHRLGPRPLRPGLVPAADRWPIGTHTTAPSGHGTPGPGGREAPVTELLPLVVLAAITCVFGFLGLNQGWFASWLGDGTGAAYSADRAEKGLLLQPAEAYHLSPGLVSTLLALTALVLGAGAVVLAVRSGPEADPARVLGPLRRPARLGFFADRAQQAAVVTPVEQTASVVAFLDRDVVDGYVRGAGLGARALGGGLRRLQTGNVQLYLTGVLTGVVVIAAVLGFGR